MLERQTLPYWFILIFAPPGNGKSLEQARLSEKLLKEYFATEKKYPTLPKRLLMSNQKLTPVPLEKYPDHYIFFEAPESIRYCPRGESCWKWKENGLHSNHDVDIFIDEGSTIFPADGWNTTPMWLRKMWAQHRHNGIRIVMLTQDFMAIDINCRRMLWQAFYMHKLIGSRDISPTLPPLVPWTWKNFLSPGKKVVWGIYTKKRFDPLVMKSDTMSMLTIEMNPTRKEQYQKLKLVGASEIHFITWHKVNLYDTTQNVKEYEPKQEVIHIEALCKKPGCGYLHKTHKLK